MEIQHAYQRKMTAQMHEWSAQINLLETKAKNASADMAVTRAKALHELRAKQHAAAEKMLELGRASGEAWGQVKMSAEKIWEELKTGLAEAQAKFK